MKELFKNSILKYGIFGEGTQIVTNQMLKSTDFQPLIG